MCVPHIVPCSTKAVKGKDGAGLWKLGPRNAYGPGFPQSRGWRGHYRCIYACVCDGHCVGTEECATEVRSQRFQRRALVNVCLVLCWARSPESQYVRQYEVTKHGKLSAHCDDANRVSRNRFTGALFVFKLENNNVEHRPCLSGLAANLKRCNMALRNRRCRRGNMMLAANRKQGLSGWSVGMVG